MVRNGFKHQQIGIFFFKTKLCFNSLTFVYMPLLMTTRRFLHKVSLHIIIRFDFYEVKKRLKKIDSNEEIINKEKCSPNITKLC